MVFSPSNDIIRAVKASYDHLKTQRTQFYGNLWYKEDQPKVAHWQVEELPGELEGGHAASKATRPAVSELETMTS